MVIPRFCIHLQKQLEVLTLHYKEKCEKVEPVEETSTIMQDLQGVIEQASTNQEHINLDIENINVKISSLQNSLIEVGEEMKSEIVVLKETSKSNLTQLIFEDELEAKKIKKEASWFNH